MKKSFTFLLMFVCLGSIAQVKNYTSSSSYLIETQSGEKRVASPIGFYYDTNYFGFYTKATGVRVFEVSDITKSKDEKGFLTESFMNAESNSMNHGDYNVMITYGPKKVIVINFTRFGQAYVIEVKSHNPIHVAMPAGMKSQIDNMDQSSLVSNASPNYDVQNFFCNTFNWSQDQRKDKDLGIIKLKLAIDTLGTVGFITINQDSRFTEGSDDRSTFMHKMYAVINKMPKWTPAKTKNGSHKKTTVDIEIKLIPTDISDGQ